MNKRKNLLLNTTLALGVPAVLLWAFIGRDEKQAQQKTTEPLKKTVQSQKRAKEESEQEVFTFSDTQPESRAALSAVQPNISVHSDENAVERFSEAVLPASIPPQIEAQIENLPPDNSPIGEGSNLEEELGSEKAAYYREQEALAFRTYDDEQVRNELELVSGQLTMDTQQFQAAELIFEESQTALSQQQMTVRSVMKGQDAEQRLASLVRLAQFRRQFLFDRLKNILGPTQLERYRESFTE